MDAPSKNLEVNMVTEIIPGGRHYRGFSFSVFVFANFLRRVCIIFIMRTKQIKFKRSQFFRRIWCHGSSALRNRMVITTPPELGFCANNMTLRITFRTFL